MNVAEPIRTYGWQFAADHLARNADETFETDEIDPRDLPSVITEFERLGCTTEPAEIRGRLRVKRPSYELLP